MNNYEMLARERKSRMTERYCALYRAVCMVQDIISVPEIKTWDPGYEYLCRIRTRLLRWMGEEFDHKASR